MKKMMYFLMVSVLVLCYTAPASAFQQVVEQYPVSSGVQYSKYVYTSGNTNRINHLAINLNDPYTEVEIGMPTAINSRLATTSIANRYTQDGYRPVGVINAAFFNMSEGFPLFLLAQDNRILNGGTVSVGAGEYMNVPTAFGVDKAGKAKIDYFDFDVTISSPAGSVEATGMNRERHSNDAIVFTPDYYYAKTNTNQYGMEIIVETEQPITDVHFGDSFTGKVTAITPYGTNNQPIPKNGFVISAHSGSKFLASDVYKTLRIGSDITVSYTINNAWDEAEFIVASGPMLIKDGQKNIQMSLSSSRATEVTARTVVGINSKNNTVHYVTVDGRQNGSPGMNMSQLADYLLKLGVDNAINLDGGGSTTMGVRKYGSNMIMLANSPSGGSQRAVNGTLMAVSTAPTSAAKTIKYTRDKEGTMLVGATSTIQVQYVLDAYYNTLPYEGKMAFDSKYGTFKISGYSFTPTKAGVDELNFFHNGVFFQSFPVTVVDGPTTMNVSGKTDMTVGQSAVYTVSNVLDAQGKALMYDGAQLKWSVEGDMGTITSTGQFTATKEGDGYVVATLGTKVVKTPVKVQPKGLFTDVPNNYRYFKEVQYLVNQQYITGYTDGSFQPNKTLSRAHGAVIIARVLGLDTSNIQNPGFSDVPTTHAYYKEIAAVENAGIISGMDGKFNPSGNLTRAQMAKIIVNAFELEGETNTVFKDVAQNHWSTPFIGTLVANNVTTGYEDGTFKPNEPITRMHYGLFLYRVLTQ